MSTPCDSPSTPRVQGSSSPDNPQPLCSPWQIDAFSKAPRSRLSPSSKVRRDLVGGRRGTGQRDRRRVHRPDAQRIVIGPDDPTLSSFGGLVGFNAMLETLGVATSRRALCAPLKTGRTVVYPMETQVRLRLDLLVVGGARIFDLEPLVGDPPLCPPRRGARLLCGYSLYRPAALR